MPFVQSDIQQIVDRLRAISLEVRTLPVARDIDPAPIDQSEAVRRAEELYMARRRRDRVFQAFDLFGEPAWDMMLDLFVMQARNRQVSVSSSCIAAAVPSTTALRYLKKLEENGLITIANDPYDRRKRYLKLSPTGVDLICAALA